MRDSYPAIVVLSSFLIMFGAGLFATYLDNAVFGWTIGTIGGAGAVTVYLIGENHER